MYRSKRSQESHRNRGFDEFNGLARPKSLQSSHITAIFGQASGA